MFIPDKVRKQNLPPYQPKLFAPIWNISHIVSSLLHSGLQRNDKYSTHNQRLVPLLLSNRQRKEQLDQCLMEYQMELDPGKPWRTKKSIRRKPIGFGCSGLFDFLFFELPHKFCKVNLLFSLLFHHKYWDVGSGLAQCWYQMLGQTQQKWTAEN